MERRPSRTRLFALVLVALLATAVFALSGGTASGRPTHSAAPAETIRQCLATLKALQAHAGSLRSMRADVLAKRIYLYTIGRFQGRPIFVPLSRKELTYLVAEQLFLGEITPSQAARELQVIKRMTADNLAALNDYIKTADGRVQSQRSHCASLGGAKPPPPPPPPPPSATTFTR